MEWYTINFLYPQAFKKFVNTMFPNIGLLSISTLCDYDTKKLYQFFDKEGIYLTLERLYPNIWVYTLSMENGLTIAPKQDSKLSREEIECDGFFECFKILDKKLTEL
jgi:hypothetical protein